MTTDDATRTAHLEAVEALEALIAPIVVRLVRQAFAAASRRMGIGETIVAAGEQFTSLDELGVIETTMRQGIAAELIPALHEIYATGSLAAVIQQGDADTAREARQAAAPIAMVVDERAVEYLARAENRLNDVGARLWTSASRSLSAGFAAGEDMTQIAGRLQSVLNVGEVRAMTIARTEVVAAANAGNLTGQKALGEGGAPYKQWLATMGPRTRDSHADADGQVVAIDEPFTVGGEPLDYPGDPSGSAEEVVNCRCTMLFVEVPEGEQDMDGRESPLELIDQEDLVAAAHAGVTTADDGTIIVTLPEGMPDLTIGPDHPDHGAWLAYMAEGDDPAPVAPAAAPGDDRANEVPAYPQLGNVDEVLARPEQWHARMVVSGIDTGDGRRFEGPFTWAPPPFTCSWQRQSDHNSQPEGSVQVGLTTRVELDPDDPRVVHGWGHFDENGVDGFEAARQVREGFLRWGSIDPDHIDESDVEEIWPEGYDPADPEAPMYPEMVIYHGGRLRGFTLCSISAEVEANVEWIGDDPQAVEPPVDVEPILAAAVEQMVIGVRVSWAGVDDETMTGTVAGIEGLGADPPSVTVAPDDGGDPFDLAVADLTVIDAEADGATVAAGVAKGIADGMPAVAAAIDDLVPPVDAPAPEATDGLVAAGLVVIASDTGRVLMLQRALDDDTAGGKWEFPGGKLDEGEDPLTAARREFTEEVGAPAPDADPVAEWTSDNGVYRGFVVQVAAEADVACNLDHEDRQLLNPDDPDGDMIEVCAWWDLADLPDNPALRDEVKATPWELLADPVEDVMIAAAVAAAHSVTIPAVPPPSWFDEPTDVDMNLGAFTVTDQGRVYGLLAPAGIPHLNPVYKGRTAPRDVDLSRFLRGETIVQGGGRVVTGALTMGCGHASTHSSDARLAAEHYDNTCSLFATVNAGVNAAGHTWVAGALLPDVTAGQIARAMASQLSGDWRPKAGRRRVELVAGLIVPVPGFAMARKRASVTTRDGLMVASAVPIRFDHASLRQARRVSAAERLARSIGRDRGTKVAEMSARVHKGA